MAENLNLNCQKLLEILKSKATPSERDKINEVAGICSRLETDSKSKQESELRTTLSSISAGITNLELRIAETNIKIDGLINGNTINFQQILDGMVRFFTHQDSKTIIPWLAYIDGVINMRCSEIRDIVGKIQNIAETVEVNPRKEEINEAVLSEAPVRMKIQKS